MWGELRKDEQKRWETLLPKVWNLMPEYCDDVNQSVSQISEGVAVLVGAGFLIMGILNLMDESHMILHQALRTKQKQSLYAQDIICCNVFIWLMLGF